MTRILRFCSAWHQFYVTFIIFSEKSIRCLIVYDFMMCRAHVIMARCDGLHKIPIVIFEITQNPL